MRSLPDHLGCPCLALRKAGRRVSQMFDEALAPSGLRATQYALVQQLAHHRGQTYSIQELADDLILDRSGLGHALKPLERAGIVTILPDPLDRRRRSVTLTAFGKNKERQARALNGKARRRFSQLLGSAEVSLTHALLLVAHNPQFGSIKDPKKD